MPLYARSGIPEAWIVDVVERAVYVYRDPGPNGYAALRIAREGESIAPLAFPDEAFLVDDMLPLL